MMNLAIFARDQYRRRGIETTIMQAKTSASCYLRLRRDGRTETLLRISDHQLWSHKPYVKTVGTRREIIQLFAELDASQTTSK